MQIKFKKKIDEAIIPTRGSEFAAGYDLYVPALEEAHKIIEPGETYLCKLGFATQFDNKSEVIGNLDLEQLGDASINASWSVHYIGFHVEVRSRSGLAKKGLIVANQPGTIDSDFTGEWGVLLHNQSDKPIEIHPSDRIAQAVLVLHFPIEFKEVEELGKTTRDQGGFGSTGY